MPQRKPAQPMKARYKHATKTPKPRVGGTGKTPPPVRNSPQPSIEKRLDAVFDRITEELLSTLEDNSAPKEK